MKRSTKKMLEQEIGSRKGLLTEEYLKEYTGECDRIIDLLSECLELNWTDKDTPAAWGEACLSITAAMFVCMCQDKVNFMGKMEQVDQRDLIQEMVVSKFFYYFDGAMRSENE